MKFIIFSVVFSFNLFAYDSYMGDPSCGQLGQKPCGIRSKEFWALGLKRCDRGLKKVKKTCVNHKRSTLKNEWVSKSLKFQRNLLENIPFKKVPIFLAHNSYNNKMDRYFLPNQFYSITDLLEIGVRGLEWDVHYVNKALRLCHGTDKHVGCSIKDRPFFNIVEELSQWIRKEENKDEIVYLFIQEEFGGRNERKAKEAFIKPLKKYLGDLIASSDQSSFSAKQLRSLGKRIIMRSTLVDKIAREDQSFETVIKNAPEQEHKPKVLKKLKRPRGPLTRLFLGNEWALKTPQDIANFFLQKPNGPIKFDYININHSKMAVWSWAEGENFWNRKGKSCVSINQQGRWVISSCMEEKPFSCLRDGEWFVTEKTGVKERGDATCSQEFPGSEFSYPKDGYVHSKLVKKARGMFISIEI